MIAVDLATAEIIAHAVFSMHRRAKYPVIRVLRDA